MTKRTRYEFYVVIVDRDGNIWELDKGATIVKEGKGKRWKALGHLKNALRPNLKRADSNKLFKDSLLNDAKSITIHKEKVILEPVEEIDGFDMCLEMKDPLAYKRKKGLEAI